MADVEEFVTISQAARALEVSERSARRAAALLPDTDRQIRQGSAARVRLSSLASQMGRAPLSGEVQQMPDKPGKMPDIQNEMPDTDRQTQSHLPDSSQSVAGHTGQMPDSELIEQLRQERDDWKRQAEKAFQLADQAQKLADQAQQLQLIAERKVSEIEGKALPPMERIEPQEAPRGDSSADSTLGGTLTPPDSEETPRRGLRAWLRRMW